MGLRREVLLAVERHGLTAGEGETPEALRERLEEVYLDDVRRLRAQQRRGEIALRDYAREAEALKCRYPLLGLPLELWSE